MSDSIAFALLVTVAVGDEHDQPGSSPSNMSVFTLQHPHPSILPELDFR